MPRKASIWPRAAIRSITRADRVAPIEWLTQLLKPSCIAGSGTFRMRDAVVARLAISSSGYCATGTSGLAADAGFPKQCIPAGATAVTLDALTAQKSKMTPYIESVCAYPLPATRPPSMVPVGRDRGRPCVIDVLD